MKLILVLLFALQNNNQVRSPERMVVKNMEFTIPSGLELISKPYGIAENIVTVTNFDGHYGHGGLIPINGMEITVFGSDKDNRELDQIIAKEMGGSNFKRSSIILDKQKAEKLVTTLKFGKLQIYTVIVYAEYKSTFYKFIFAMNNEKENRKPYKRKFDQLLSTVKFRT